MEHAKNIYVSLKILEEYRETIYTVAFKRKKKKTFNNSIPIARFIGLVYRIV